MVARDDDLLDFNAGFYCSSGFAADFKRFGFFPSLSAGWVLSKGNLLSKIDWL